jgi:hypothetical protein
MTTFVKFSNSSKNRKPVYLNVENVNWLESADHNDNVTTVRFPGDKVVVVEGTPEDVVAAIRQAAMAN